MIELVNNARYYTKNNGVEKQLMYFYDTEYKTVHDKEDIKGDYIEYIGNNEVDGNFCYNDYVEMITDKNGTMEKLYLNDFTEFEFIERNIDKIQDIDMLLTMINVMNEGKYNNVTKLKLGDTMLNIKEEV